MSVPRVFISYAWQSSDHKAWVRQLAETLRGRGVNVKLDQWDLKLGESTTHFMETEVAAADYVLLICTPAFAQKSNARKGGAGYEQQIVSGHIITGTPRSKFIPIIREGTLDQGPNCALPTHFLGTYAIDYRGEMSFSDRDLEDLLRAVFAAPRHVPPTLGSPPNFASPLEPITAGSVARASIVFAFDEELQPIGGLEELEIAFEEALLDAREHGDLRITVVLPTYDNYKAELAEMVSASELSTEVRKRRVEIRKKLQAVARYNADPSIVVEALVKSAINSFTGLGLLGARNYALSLIEAMSLHMGRQRNDAHTVGFDAIRSEDCIFRFYTTELEAEKLATREKVSVSQLTREWGLTLWDFSDEVLVRSIAPAMANKFCQIKFAGQVVPEKFFSSNWTVGLA
jgi:TIR domain